MKRFPFIFTVILMFPSFVVAQDLTVQITEIEDPDGTTRDGTDLNRPFNLYECENASDVTLTITVTSASSTTLEGIDIWVGSESAACDTEDDRDPSSGSCDFAGHTSATSDSPPEVTLTFAELIEILDSDPCEASSSSSSSSVQVFFLNTSYTEDTSDISDNYGSFTIDIDPAAPDAPTADDTDVQAESGFSISWATPTDSDSLVYYVYVDTTGTCTDGVPSSDLLIEGSDAPSSGVTVISAGTDASSYTLDSDYVGDIGSQAVVAIAAEDVAENVSYLSDLICVEVVDTQSFCDALDGDCSQNCSVLTPGSSSNYFSLLQTILAFSAGFIYLRRRGSHIS